MIKYKLKIEFESDVNTFNKLTEILGIEYDTDSWNTPRIQTGIIRQTTAVYKTDDSYSNLLDLLEANYLELEKLNIKKDDISIWMLYEYIDQCNMEFNPLQLKRFSDSGIHLCISCWQKV